MARTRCAVRVHPCLTAFKEIPMAQHLIVIGGGITGVTSAYALARQGHRVTLIEKHRYAGMETSHANGGQLSASNAETWTHPSTLLKGIKWMLKADAPLLVNPKPSWHKLSWFAEFAAAIPKYRENTIATAQLAIAARVVCARLREGRESGGEGDGRSQRCGGNPGGDVLHHESEIAPASRNPA